MPTVIAKQVVKAAQISDAATWGTLSPCQQAVSNCNNYYPCCTKGQKGEPGCPLNACTYLAVKNPTTQIIIPVDTPTPGSAQLKIQADSDYTQLANWTPIVNFDPALFNLVTGTFTVPSTGDYIISLVVNYRTTNAIPVLNDLSNLPTIEVCDLNTTSHLIGSHFPVSRIVIPPISTLDPGTDVSYILVAGQVIIDTLFSLVAGQQIGICFHPNGLITEVANSDFASVLQVTDTIMSFAFPNADTTLTISRVRNTPSFTFNCNN